MHYDSPQHANPRSFDCPSRELDLVLFRPGAKNDLGTSLAWSTFDLVPGPRTPPSKYITDGYLHNVGVSTWIYAIKKMFADLVTGTEAYIEGLINTAYSNDLVAYTVQSGLVNSPFAPYEKSSKFWSAIQDKVKTDGTDESFKCLPPCKSNFRALPW